MYTTSDYAEKRALKEKFDREWEKMHRQCIEADLANAKNKDVNIALQIEGSQKRQLINGALMESDNQTFTIRDSTSKELKTYPIFKILSLTV